MIRVEVKPRQDNLFDIYVGDEGDQFVNSSQGYENLEDALTIVHRLWPKPDQLRAANDANAIVLRVTHRDGKSYTAQIQ